MHRIVPFPLLLCILLSLQVHAQSGYSIQGRVTDTLNNVTLRHASISLIRAKDSILTAFTRSDSTGAFSLSPDSADKYILLIAYPGFADFIDAVHVTNAGVIRLGVIPLVSSTHLLQ